MASEAKPTLSAADKYAALKQEVQVLGAGVLAKVVDAHSMMLEEQHFLQMGGLVEDYTPGAARTMAATAVVTRRLDYVSKDGRSGKLNAQSYIRNEMEPVKTSRHPRKKCKRVYVCAQITDLRTCACTCLCCYDPTCTSVPSRITSGLFVSGPRCLESTDF